MRLFLISSVVTLSAVSFTYFNQDKTRQVLRPYLLPIFSRYSPLDKTIGQLPVLNTTQLQEVFNEKRVLVVGGSRGVGRGVSLALAEAGAHVSIVGRSEKSAKKVIDEIKSRHDVSAQYIQGDLSTRSLSNKLIHDLTQVANEEGRFHHVVVTAGVFPDWTQPLLQEDNMDRSFAVYVQGRFIIYNNLNKFMETPPNNNNDEDNVRQHSAVLNVIGSGEKPMLTFDRDIASGSRPVSNLIEAVACASLGNELMLLGLQQNKKLNDKEAFDYAMVSTHPGLLHTDLHNGQGWLMDIFEPIGVALMGISEEECGYHQASILAYTATNAPVNSLTYVDSLMQARLKSKELQKEEDEHLDWLWKLLN